MYNTVGANLLQYTFEQEPTKTIKNAYPAVVLSRQKIDEVQYQQQDFLLVGTDITVVVKNSNIYKDGALLYGAYRRRDWYIPNMEKYIRSVYPHWMGWHKYLDQNNQCISTIQFF